MLQVNVNGVLNGISSVLAGMKERKNGTIVNISSVAGRKAFAGNAVYCGSKFAVHSISEALRSEASEYGVRVVIISPGIAETELLSHSNDKRVAGGYEAFRERFGTLMSADDVANAVIYAVQQPPYVCIREIALAPTGQLF